MRKIVATLVVVFCAALTVAKPIESSKEAIFILLNTGSSVVKGFEARYYFREAGENIEYRVYDSVGAKVNLVDAGGGLYYISVMYSELTLNPGEKTFYGNGAKFELFHTNYTADFNVDDDPSYHGITGRELAEVDSVVVLDLAGNVLWGHAPSPKFDGENAVVENVGGYIYRDGENVYVTVDAKDKYSLQIVNAAGMPLVNLFSGVWDEGEHAVNVTDSPIAANSYLVLRRNSTILTWQLLK